MKFGSILPVALTALCSATTTYAAGQPKNSVLLRNIKSLTLYKDRMTTHKRVSAIPQLQCIGGSGKGHYEVDVMRCTNSGSSYDDDNVDWTCKASLPPEFKLGSTDVICEGYSSSDDPYILKGSCGVEYRLILTDLGEEKYGSTGWFRTKSSKTQQQYKAPSSINEPASEKFFNFIFWCLFIGVGLWIAYVFLKSFFGGELGTPRRRGGGRRPGGGGSNNDDNDDPPPPYDPRPPRPTYSKPRSSPWTTTSSTRSSEQWRPGFWTGAATGAAAAYAANRASRTRTEEQARQQEQSWFQRGWNTGNPGAAPGSSWFNTGRNNDAGEGPSGSRNSHSSSEPPSSSRYDSTGFGSTRRR